METSRFAPAFSQPAGPSEEDTFSKRSLSSDGVFQKLWVQLICEISKKKQF